MSEPSRIPVPVRPKSPIMVAIASVLIPGLGQFLVGQRAKGAFFGILTIFSLGLGYLLAPALAWDANIQARRQKAGEAIDPWGFF